MDLKPIRVFLSVAARESFSAAAAELDLAPASVTRIVAQLEQDLGTQLLVRTTRQVGLTSAGALVAARFRPILESFDAATDEVRRAHRPDRGTLRITAPVSFGVQLLPRMLAGFRLVAPHVDVALRLTDTLVDVIAETCDLAIRVSRPPRDQLTIWRKLCEVPRQAIASPAFLARESFPDDPRDLDPDWLMSYGPDGKRELWEFSQAGARRQIRAGARLSCNNGDVLYGLVAAGEGLAVLPDFITARGRAQGEVTVVLPEWHLPSLWLTLAYPPYDKLPPLVSLFAECFEAFISEQPTLAPETARGGPGR